MRRLALLSLVCVPFLAQAALIKGNLKKKDVTAFSFDPPTMTLCPGEAKTFEVLAATSDGKSWSTKGQIVWTEYTLSLEGGTVEKKGEYAISANPIDTWGKVGTLKAVSEFHPDKLAETTVTTVYGCSFIADNRGAAGPGGQSGASGARGNTGGTGGQGGDGARGGKGTKGHEVEVFVNLGVDPVSKAKILQVKVHDKTTNTDGFFAIDPNGGMLSIDASGGTGGGGGQGGAGGSGGSAPANGSGGNGGQGGNGGDGGDGATGGVIVATFSAEARAFEKSFSFNTAGGSGGFPGGGGGGGSAGVGASAGPAGVASPNRGSKGDDGPKPTVQTGNVKAAW